MGLEELRLEAEVAGLVELGVKREEEIKRKLNWMIVFKKKSFKRGVNM
jgi:hypothetical protein